MIALFLAVSLALAKNSSGVTRQQPIDTLNVNGVKVLGVAVPTGAFMVPGDMNYDGKRSMADIVALIGNVLGGKALPAPPLATFSDTTVAQVMKDTTAYLFIPTGGKAR